MGREISAYRDVTPLTVSSVESRKQPPMFFDRQASSTRGSYRISASVPRSVHTTSQRSGRSLPQYCTSQYWHFTNILSPYIGFIVSSYLFWPQKSLFWPKYVVGSINAVFHGLGPYKWLWLYMTMGYSCRVLSIYITFSLWCLIKKKFTVSNNRVGSIGRWVSGTI